MRWRCLTKPIMFQPRNVSRIITACGALHNFALTHNDLDPNDLYEYDALDDVINANIENEVIDDQAVRVKQGLAERVYRP